MGLNSRGQASVTDAMYFLIIVSGLAALMFFFIGGYGSLVSVQLDKQYKTEFATSALKTIFYSSAARDDSRSEPKTLQDSDEIDYLLAVLKEDYADDYELNENTQRMLVKNIRAVMSPLESSFDYLFYIYLPNTPNAPHPFPIIILVGSKEIPSPDADSDKVTLSRSIWVCHNSGPSDLASIESTFVSKVGEVSRAPILSVFLAEPSGQYYQNVRALSSILMWPITDDKRAIDDAGMGSDDAGMGSDDAGVGMGSCEEWPYT